MIRHLHPDLAHIPENEESILAWNARNFIPWQHSRLWWALAALVTSGLIWLALHFDLPGLAALLVMIAIYFVLHKWRVRPRVETIALTKSGVWIDHKFIPYNKIDSFRIVFIPHQTSVLELSLHRHHVREIELEDTPPADVREVLLHFVPESDGGSTLHYYLAHFLKI